MWAWRVPRCSRGPAVVLPPVECVVVPQRVGFAVLMSVETLTSAEQWEARHRVSGLGSNTLRVAASAVAERSVCTADGWLYSSPEMPAWRPRGQAAARAAARNAS